MDHPETRTGPAPAGLHDVLYAADRALERGALPGGREILERGAALLPGEAVRWASLASVTLACGDPAAARAPLERALARAPEDAAGVRLQTRIGAGGRSDAGTGGPAPSCSAFRAGPDGTDGVSFTARPGDGTQRRRTDPRRGRRRWGGCGGG